LVKSSENKKSKSANFRYIKEDVKCNLALLCSIGDLCNVETPIADALLKLIGVLVDEDFTETGRTLDSLGLSEKPVDELLAFLHKGF